MKGFRNLGNTCYLSAVVQCLAYTPALANYFSSGTYRSDVARKRLNASALCDEFASVMNTYWKTRAVPDLASLAEKFAKCHRSFNVFVQHDAHEFMQMLVRDLHWALGKTVRFPSLSDAHVDRDAWHLANDNGGYSFLTEVFQSQVVVKLSDTSDVHYEHDWGFSLAIDGTSSVAAALAKYLGDEACHDGGRTVRISRKIVYAPLILVLHLKRFDNSLTKVERFVDYGTELTLPGGTARYALYAVICHTGCVSSGHCYAFCEVKGIWFRLDDADSTKVEDINAVVTRDAYVLMYKRVT